MAASIYYFYHETPESREAREAWNELNTGERGGSDEQPAILAFPTTAGPVQLDLSKYGLSGERPDAAGSPSSSPGGRPRSVGGGVTKNGRQQQQRSHTRGLSGWRRDRRDSTKSEISDADAAEATANGSEGKEGKLRTTSVSFSDSVAVQRLFPKRAAGEEDPPPLSAEEAKARATRSAIAVEFANRSLYGKSRMDDSGDDLSA